MHNKLAQKSQKGKDKNKENLDNTLPKILKKN